MIIGVDGELVQVDLQLLVGILQRPTPRLAALLPAHRPAHNGAQRLCGGGDVVQRGQQHGNGRKPARVREGDEGNERERDGQGEKEDVRLYVSK